MASSTSPVAEDSTLKRRARRRLLGSIALVLVAVIALPMIFDDEKKPLDQDVSVQIPNQEAVTVKSPESRDGKAKIVEPKEPKGLTDAPAKAETVPVQPRSAPPAASLPEPPKAAAKGEPAAEARAEPKAEAKPAPKAEPKAVAKAEPKAGPSRSEEDRVKAILDGAVAKDAAAKEAASGFAVQIGAFSTEDKIREAREKLGAAGFKTYTEKLDTKDGERTRVRAGPFSSRDAAEAARDKIRALGFASAGVVAK